MTSHDLGAAGEFPPHVLREYALVADGERGALVGPRGDFAWLCAPRWDADGVFSCLIGGPGVYAVTPEEPRFVWGGYYEGGTLGRELGQPPVSAGLTGRGAPAVRGRGRP